MVKESAKGRKLGSPMQVFNMMKPVFAKDEIDREHMYYIFLNQKTEILKIEKLFSGSISGSAIWPREIIKKVIEYKASVVIMVHNHPSGDPAPSMEDDSLTRLIYLALKSIDVMLLDHVIIGQHFFSFADTGCLSNYISDYNKYIKGGNK